MKRPWTPAHLHSPLHRSARRLHALLETNCLSFAEIGHRLGLTRERVRQLAGYLGYIGRVRQASCSLNRSLREATAQPLTKALLAAVPPAYHVVPVKTQTVGFPSARFSRKVVAINGQACQLFRAHLSSKGFYQLPACRPRAEINWYVGRVEGTADWVILPREKLPRVGTMFSPYPPRQPSPAARRPGFCNWRQFVNAWHLLPLPPAQPK